MSNLPEDSPKWLATHLETGRTLHLSKIDGWQVVELHRDTFQAAVIEKLIVNHIYVSDHDTQPRKAVSDLIACEVSMALDPKISSDAQALVDKGKPSTEERVISVSLLHELLDILHTPDSNCSCHISPPCSDCVEYGLTRILYEQVRSILKGAP